MFLLGFGSFFFGEDFPTSDFIEGIFTKDLAALGDETTLRSFMAQVEICCKWWVGWDGG